ncbi:hypothetical protein HDE_04624 [Halotydeus destructor]|nr:hypothetical protein HDE_04624 [Halotydeus destructor]
MSKTACFTLIVLIVIIDIVTSSETCHVGNSTVTCPKSLPHCCPAKKATGNAYCCKTKPNMMLLIAIISGGTFVLVLFICLCCFCCSGDAKSKSASRLNKKDLEANKKKSPKSGVRSILSGMKSKSSKKSAVKSKSTKSSKSIKPTSGSLESIMSTGSTKSTLKPLDHYYNNQDNGENGEDERELWGLKPHKTEVSGKVVKQVKDKEVKKALQFAADTAAQPVTLFEREFEEMGDDSDMVPVILPPEIAKKARPEKSSSSKSVSSKGSSSFQKLIKKTSSNDSMASVISTGSNLRPDKEKSVSMKKKKIPKSISEIEFDEPAPIPAPVVLFEREFDEPSAPVGVPAGSNFGFGHSNLGTHHEAKYENIKNISDSTDRKERSSKKHHSSSSRTGSSQGKLHMANITESNRIVKKVSDKDIKELLDENSKGSPEPVTLFERQVDSDESPPNTPESGSKNPRNAAANETGFDPSSANGGNSWNPFARKRSSSPSRPLAELLAKRKERKRDEGREEEREKSRSSKFKPT